MENQTVSMLGKYHISDINQTINFPKLSISYRIEFVKSIAISRPTNTNFEKKNTNTNELEER